MARSSSNAIPLICRSRSFLKLYPRRIRCGVTGFLLPSWVLNASGISSTSGISARCMCTSSFFRVRMLWLYLLILSPLSLSHWLQYYPNTPPVLGQAREYQAVNLMPHCIGLFFWMVLDTQGWGIVLSSLLMLPCDGVYF